MLLHPKQCISAVTAIDAENLVLSSPTTGTTKWLAAQFGKGAPSDAAVSAALLLCPCLLFIFEAIRNLPQTTLSVRPLWPLL